MIRLACDAGMVGGSIEDSTGDARRPIYDFTLAVERVRAAVEVARSLPVSFVLTARAENFVNGVHDLDDTIRRLQASSQLEPMSSMRRVSRTWRRSRRRLGRQQACQRRHEPCRSDIDGFRSCRGRREADQRRRLDRALRHGGLFSRPVAR
jgi:hypothetical protein